jgi:hypothetical protein
VSENSSQLNSFNATGTFNKYSTLKMDQDPGSGPLSPERGSLMEMVEGPSGIKVASQDLTHVSQGHETLESQSQLKS